MFFEKLLSAQSDGSNDGWTKVPGGYIPTKGEEQLYYVDKSGRLIPSWRAENLPESDFNLFFRHTIKPDGIGPYVLGNQINFSEPVNNINAATIAFYQVQDMDDNLSFNMWSENNLMYRYSRNTFVPDFRYGSGSYVAWQVSGYSFTGNQLGFFTLTVTQ